MIKAKALSADELGTIEDEWNDSTVVKQLLGHIRYLTDAVIKGADTGWLDDDKGGK